MRLGCRTPDCHHRAETGEGQLQVVPPVHELAVADGQMLQLSFSIERGGGLRG